MLNIKRIICDVLEENCYVIYDDKAALIVDPGSSSEKIKSFIIKNNLDVKGILITHYHFDHIGALEDIKDTFKVENIYDYKMDGEVIIDDFKFKIIHNPGHTLDSVSFYFDGILFSGDFIFKETIGNYDDKNYSYMLNSLKKFKLMNESVIIYPGHGESTNVSHELKYNMFLRGI